jgi:hypothetical protein
VNFFPLALALPIFGSWLDDAACHASCAHVPCHVLAHVPIMPTAASETASRVMRHDVTGSYGP